MLEFSYRPQVFYGFCRGKRSSDGTLIEWERDVDVLVAIFSPLFLIEKRVLLNSDLWKPQSRGDMENNIHEE